jgi:hypothetical protein
MAYVAIKTQWFAPTNYRGGRIKGGGRIKATTRDNFRDARQGVSPLPHPRLDWDGHASTYYISITKASDGYGEQSQEEMHHAVAMELLPQVCNSPNDVELVAGATRTGYVFVVVRKALGAK